jgi:hypothetical protein
LRRKLEEMQSKFLQDTRPLIQELLETELPRFQRVLRERQKDFQAAPAALLEREYAVRRGWTIALQVSNVKALPERPFDRLQTYGVRPL